MKLETLNTNDMLRLINFIQKYKYIFLAGKPKYVFYAKGEITIRVSNSILDNLNGKFRETNDDDCWRIVIEKY